MRKRTPVKESHLPSILSVYPSTLLALAFCLCALFLTYLTYQSLKKSQYTGEQRYQAYLLATQLQQRSDKLTLMVRNYAVTGNEQYLDSYHNTLQKGAGRYANPPFYYRLYWDLLASENDFTSFSDAKKNTFQTKLAEFHLTVQEKTLLTQAKTVADTLTQLELQVIDKISFTLSSEAVYQRSTARTEAIAFLYSNHYLEQKAYIEQHISDFLGLQEPRGLYEQQKKLSQHYVLAGFTILSFLLLILFLIYNLHMQSKNKLIFAKALRREVSNRTLELFEKREQLKVVIHEMEATKEQLVESEKMASLGNLVGGVAHEVNTPLGISVTLGSHLQEETKALFAKVEKGKLKRSDLDEFCSECIENCTLLLSNLDRAANLISSFKQVAVDQTCDEIRIFKLSEYLDEILLSLKPQIKKTDIQVTVEAPENEPSLETYPGAIAQITTNLVINTIIHAFSNGTESGTLKIILCVKDTDMLMVLKDSGAGMSKEVEHQIFEPFYTTRRGNGGSGLGMSIVYNLVVHQLRGEIRCQSTLGEGTTFTICFPMQIETKK